jgi:sialic acid synthase SpsE
MKIGSFDLTQKVLVVAEIGNNHEGDFARAGEMIRQAAACGADAVKFQAIVPEELVSPDQAQRRATLQRFRLSWEQFISLATLARSQGLLFLMTPFDLEGVRVLAPHIDAIKIASGDNTFLPLLDAAAGTMRPLIISTGLLDLAGVRKLVDYVMARLGPDRSECLALLHCVCAYPVPDDQANLAAIPVLRANLPCPIGYSDHTLGIDAAVFAVAAGARIIEKHFTLDKHASDYRDHQLSADPADMRNLVAQIRRVERMCGPEGKALQAVEVAMEGPVRRSIAAGRDLPAGHVITGSDFSWLRPGGGLAPGGESRLLGRRLRVPLKRGERFSMEALD